MNCTLGQRDQLIGILLGGIFGMPGCLRDVVARDPQDPEGMWVSEVWESQDPHWASLSLPAVPAAIKPARPLIARFGERFETEPGGGHGLVAPSLAA